MTIVRRSLADLKANPPKLTQEERKRLEALTDADIEKAATEDSDAAILSDAQLDRMVVSRMVRQTREATGLSQTQFAKQFRIHPSRVRDWEQGRFQPDAMAQAYLKVIRSKPTVVRTVLGPVEDGPVRKRIRRPVARQA